MKKTNAVLVEEHKARLLRTSTERLTISRVDLERLLILAGRACDKASLKASSLRSPNPHFHRVENWR